MELKIKIILIISSILFLLYIFSSVNKEKAHLKYALLWMISVVFTLIVALFPNFIMIIISWLEIETISNFMFYLAIIFLLIICFSLTIIVSKQKEQILKLSQELALSNVKHYRGNEVEHHEKNKRIIQ